MISLLLLLTFLFLVFVLFTAAQLIGFVFKAIGWALSGLFALVGWILSGTWAVAKVVLVLAVFLLFGMHVIGLATIILALVLIIGIARLAFERRARPRVAFYREDDLVSRLRRDIGRMRRRMDSLETILERR